MHGELFLTVEDADTFEGVVLDCRFNLQEPGAGRDAYRAGHLPGAHFLDLEADLSAPRGRHGGRHPLPPTRALAARLASLGIDRDRSLLIYDGGEIVFAARLWWMLRGLGYGPLRLLAGGYRAWADAGHVPETSVPQPQPVPAPSVPAQWPGCCDREGLRALQADGIELVDAREGPRYRGERETIDPVAGHIPGAINRPWMDLTHPEHGLRPEEELRQCWGDALQADRLVVYCGSGVSACINILSLVALGRDDAVLYGGSWSDWCSYL